MAKKRRIFLWMGIFVAVLFSAFQGWALEYTVGGRPFEVMGFINQGVNYGITGDSHYETQSGFNSFLTDAKLELGYTPSDRVKLFVSGRFNGDWAYQVNSSNSEWDKKNFDKSKGRLFILDDWQDILNEAHVTWASDKFYLRAGKQIVQWGETDGWLLTNVINPVDGRRGMADVKFENNILPIWMVRAEYNTPIDTDWFNQFGLQFIFDPKFQFRGNQDIRPGNDYQGVWAPIAEVPLGGPYPFDTMHVGSFNTDLEKLHDFDPKGFTYGLKMKGNIMDAMVNLLFYYGRDRDVVMTDKASITTMEFTNPWDGRMVFHPGYEAYYPYFKFVGATVTKDLNNLKASFLGGVAPVLRIETMYAFNSSYAMQDKTTLATTQVAKTDEFRGMIGFDWKVKIPFLNSTANFMVSPQYFYQKVMDYPHGDYALVQRGSVGPQRFEVANHKSALMVNTTYFNAKVTPTLFWLRDWTNRADMYKAQVAYAPTSNWTYTVGGIFISGEVSGWGMGAMQNKDQLFATIGYSF